MRAAPRRVATGSALLLGLLGAACAPIMDEAPAATPPERPTASAPVPPRPTGPSQVGGASYYARHFAGRRMANGRRFDPGSTSVAHRTLPFGTVVQVTNLSNGRTVTATVEDRGPFHARRIVDLSPRLAADLGMMRQGVGTVEVTPVEVAEAPE